MRSFLVSFGGGALGALLVIVLYSAMRPAQVFASVDVQQLLSAHVAAISNQSLDAEMQRQDAAAFAGALEAALDQIARDDRAILLVSPAILRGAPDVTGEVRELIEHRLAETSQHHGTASP